MNYNERLSGNEAIAFAMKQIDPDVMAAFPITPSTEIPQYFAQYVANGEVNTEFVPVESEHSSMSACIGAEAAGARAVTATSSAGLALMYEMMYVAASSRLPITLACVNRALTGPININNDHSDSMGIRDAGWIQIYAENNQEAYDNFLQAMPIGEHPSVRLPVMICQDGFITSHALENIVLLDTDSVKAFVGEYRPEHFLLKAENPLAIGPYDLGCHYMEHKGQQAEAMKGAKKRILEVAAQFAALTGREYGLFEAYRMEDAEIALVLIGSSAGTAKVTGAGDSGGPGKDSGLPPLPGGGTGPDPEEREGPGHSGQGGELLCPGRPPVCGGPGGPLRSGAPSPYRGICLRPGGPGYHPGAFCVGLCPAGGHCGRGRTGSGLFTSGTKGVNGHGKHRENLSFQKDPGEKRTLCGGTPPLRRLRGGHCGPGRSAGPAGGGPGGGGQRHRLPGGQLLPLSLHRL